VNSSSPVTGISPRHRSTALATVVVDELVRGGMREAVLCPGSRNAPLSYALHAAAAAGLLRLHVRIDERSAAFLALGLALGSGAPVPVVTTSGTAVANLHPAVLEAGHARVPLLVLSADRPPELLGSGANQTVDQRGLFGGAVRAALTMAGDEPARWRAAVCRALAAATGARDGNPGPVHVDVPFAEPLVPDGTGCPPGRADGGPWTVVAPARVDAPLELDLGVPTLVVAGAGARMHAELSALPTVAEPGAPAPELGVHPLAARAFTPEQVVVVGRPTLHRGVAQLLASDAAVHVLTDGRQWSDVAANVRSVGTRVVTTGSPATAWLHGWAAASARAADAVAAVLDADGPATGLHVARAVAAALGDGDLVVLGSSNPVRDASLVGLPTFGVRVLANRGVAGIDGTVSTALGAALGSLHPGRSVALLGDLTFLHDSGGLLLGADEPRPDLTLVVANDDGGGIFTTLEQGAPEHSAAFERLFGTPHGTDLGALCGAHGVAHGLVGVGELGGALAEVHSGLRVLEVRTDRSGLRRLHARLRAAVTGAG
jgi:2-succinyl-5-enolpyruvyl-6-hydroxy-3-cyclohexene-1-carboxylate synthase